MVFPINMGRFKKWAIEQTYYLLFPYIAKDFMGRGGCKLVHLPGNINSSPTGGPVTYLVAQGGCSMDTDALKPIYQVRAELGEVQSDIASETGEFTG